MLSKQVVRFYCLLILLYFSDMVLLLSNIWNSLKVTSSPIFLGITLSVGTALPFVLSKIKVFKVRKYLNLSGLYRRRIVIFTLLLIVAILQLSATKFGFIITSLSIGYLSLITLSTLEASNSKLVLDGYISSEYASRIMQTIVQIGAFIGALIGGYLLTKIHYNSLIMSICVFDIVVSSFGNLLYKDSENENLAKNEVDGNIDAKEKNIAISAKLKLLSLSIGMIGLHICAFNTLTPILFQNIKGFNADFFGACSGVAGIGAFSAAFINMKGFKFLLPAIILTVSDFVFAKSDLNLLILMMCFIIGFSINTIRIKLRKEMIDETSTKEEAGAVAKYSATIYTFTQALGPLIFGILTSGYLLGPVSSVYLLPVVGLLLFIFLLMMSRKGKNTK